ncbi:MAG: DNA repair protein RecN [Betaproteobacteria bacterium]|nr:DNA repair protein RecN [Betaproteobacteria bacterium]
MLLRLTVRDFVVVDRLELEFASGFTALTGETGAGKSILVDALALALGERADPGLVRSGRERAEIAAVFALTPSVEAWLREQDFPADDEELLLRRVVEAGGRSRAYINGSPASAQQLKGVCEMLVDIHGQHAHQSLLRVEAQRELLDAHGNLSALAREVGIAWKNWRELAERLEVARSGMKAGREERDMLAWQIEELEKAVPHPGEWSELEAEQRRLAHAANLIEGAQYALSVLSEGENACDSMLAAVAGRVAAMAELDAELVESSDILQSVDAEISEIVSRLRRYAGRTELDPARLAEVEARQENLLALARKHRAEVERLPEVLAGFKERFASLSEAADIEVLLAKAEHAGECYRELAGRLSEKRQETALQLAEAVSMQMRQLALGSGRFEVALPVREGGSVNGNEQVEFRVAGLADDEARALARVASGGELSRISLALQVVASRNAAVPTLIFDEVDVGIGGGVAEIVGRLLAKLGEERQVLCVTHLPQVAARAGTHWQVSKSVHDGKVTSNMALLDGAARIEEIARMLGGVEMTSTTRQHAKEMLSME